MPVRLNLGAGLNQKKGEGWVNIDCRALPGVDKVQDIKKLDYPDGSVDEVFANDVLEHINWRRTEKVLREWARVLKPGGKIYIQCPDIQALAWRITDKTIKQDRISYWIYGSADYGVPSLHKAAFTKEYLQGLLEKVGIKVEKIRGGSRKKGEGTNIQVWGVKK